MNPQKNIISVVLIILIISSILYLNSDKSDRNSNSEVITVTQRLSADRKTKAKIYQLAKEITTPDGFINTGGKPIAINELIGKKVILVDFWTYSCINCKRTTPYLNAWYEKYKDKGFVIIGIHTPEFEFEKLYQNVLDATKKESIKYPVVLDNDYSTWSAYQNRFWPRKYLIDIDGYIVYDHIGEGAYEETERKIQDALKERMAVLGDSGTIDQSLMKETPVQSGAKSPETYFGANRNEYLGNGTPGKIGRQSFTEPAAILKNTLYLIGEWNLTGEHAETSATVGPSRVGSHRIKYLYQAKNVFLVAGSPGESIDVEVLLDGNPIPSSAKGKDIFYKDGKSYITVSGNRLYTIVEDTAHGEHLLEFIISSPGFQAFAFTFG